MPDTGARVRDVAASHETRNAPVGQRGIRKREETKGGRKAQERQRVQLVAWANRKRKTFEPRSYRTHAGTRAGKRPAQR